MNHSSKAPLSHRNWAQNLTYATDRLYEPATVTEAQEIVRSHRKIHPIGSRHCFNTIADSTHAHISLSRLKQVVELDRTAHTVTVEAGMRYGDLCPWLHEQGYALHNLASLPHISIVGACATATHGSGVAHGNLATVVSGIEFINANGDLVHLLRDKDADVFAGAMVGLGGLGVVTRLTLDLVPAFEMTQHIYQKLPLQALNEHFDEIMESGYSVSLFTDWQSDAVNQVWVKRRVDDDREVGPEFFGARLAATNLHPIQDHPAKFCTPQMGLPGPWYERLPHFRMEFTPSSGKELQSEYFVPREYAPDVARTLHAMRDLLAPLLMISEVRTIAADELWMSPCYGRPCVAFHFTCHQKPELLQKTLPIIEEALQPYEARPHWGKMFTMQPDRLQAHYIKLPDFRDLLRTYDPEGKFRNAFLDEKVF